MPDKFDDCLLNPNCCMNVEVVNKVSEPIRGRLGKNIEFWRSIGASSFVLNVLKNGYYLPLTSEPPRTVARNHASALKHALFVSESVKDLCDNGSVLEVSPDDIHVCSPLGVAEGKKLRLILDLRELNKCLDVVHFKYDDIRTACNLFDVGDFFFVFDLKSAYHHVDIDPQYYKYLGFEWGGRHYVFASLPFGLCTAPYVFTKICRVLVKAWRARGLRIFMYLDDGACAAASREDCQSLSDMVKGDLLNAGFLLSEKSRFTPSQAGELLGFKLV